MATVLNIDHRELYKEIRTFLLGIFPDASQQIVQAIQNNEPLPYNAIVMHFLFEQNRDESTTTYADEDKAHVQNSVEARIQLDFYGPLAQGRSRTVYTLWKNYYGADNMGICQPLYVHSYNRLPYVNDSKQYEDRFVLDLALMYNPQITHDQDFADSAAVRIDPVAGD